MRKPNDMLVVISAELPHSSTSVTEANVQKSQPDVEVQRSNIVQDVVAKQFSELGLFSKAGGLPIRSTKIK